MSLTLPEPTAPTFAAAEVVQPPPLLVTADDIAAALRISRRTVFRLRARGDLPQPVELAPNVVRWRWADVCDYLDRLKSRKPCQRKGVRA